MPKYRIPRTNVKPLKLETKIDVAMSEAIDTVAEKRFEGNRSAAIRWLMHQGMQSPEAREYLADVSNLMPAGR